MLPSTKRNLVLGMFLVIVTLVILYSYCNGNSVCYTFPFFSGLERDRLVKPEVVVTSVIVQTKRPFNIGRFSGKSKGKQDESREKQSEPFIEDYQKNDEKTTKNISEEKGKLHFDHNKTYLIQEEIKNNKTQAEKTSEPKKHLLPPSDIVGKVAEEILRRANVSEEEVNRELIRVEKVDEIVDNEKRKQENALLRKVKESRRVGENKAEKKLVRVERVDLTDEEEEENKNQSEKEVQESRDKSVNSAANRSRRIEFSAKPKYEKLELVHARRFGIINATSSILNGKSTMMSERDKTRNFSTNNTAVDEPAITLPPFFANFLNITAREREMVDLLHNFTKESKALQSLDGPEERIFHQEENGTEKENLALVKGMETSSAHVQKVDARENRKLGEASLLDTLVAKLLNTTNERQTIPSIEQNTSGILNKSLNLTAVLAKITKKGLETKYPETLISDSTALLVKFLKEGSRYRLRMPHNFTAGHVDNDSSQIATKKLESDKTELQSSSKESPLDLKKVLLDLTNRIDLNFRSNRSEMTKDKENEADLGMLKLLLHHSALQDLGTFNLSHVLKEIASNSLNNILTSLQPIKVKRDKEEDDLEASGAQSDVKIFRPTADELESGTMELRSSDGNKQPSSMHASLNTTSSVTDFDEKSRKRDLSFTSGSGTDEPEDELSVKSQGSEEKKNEIVPSKPKKQGERLKRATNGILKFDNIGCEELDPKVLLYNRIFKTGSSTTESIIINSSSAMNYDYKIGTTEDWYDKGESGPYPGLIIRKAYKKLVKHPRMAFVAHFYFRSNLNLPQIHTYINQVRHPVRRLVSHYHYMRSTNRPKYRIKEFLASGERNESLEQCFRRQHKGCRKNVMTRFFCGRHFYCRRGNWKALQKAKRNIKRYYAVVGLLEHYEVYLQILYKRLPKFFPEVSSNDIGKFKYNPTYSFDNVPKDLIGEITKANWADARLYSFLKKRFWQQAKTCGIK